MEHQPRSRIDVDASDEHIVIDVELSAVNHGKDAAGAGIQHDEDAHRCAICKQASPWVAVGQCGHRAVCSKCMVRRRFFHRDKRCHVCKARCPKVVVTRAIGGAAVLPAALPSFCFRDRKVGKYWYHKHTAAFFEDEQEYQTARDACHGIMSPFYQPIFCFLPLIAAGVVVGAALGQSILYEMKTPSNRSLQITVYAVTLCVTVPLSFFLWYLIKRTEDPLVVEAIRTEGGY